MSSGGLTAGTVLKDESMNNEMTIIDALKPPLLIRSVSGSAFYLLINGKLNSVQNQQREIS